MRSSTRTKADQIVSDWMTETARDVLSPLGVPVNVSMSLRVIKAINIVALEYVEITRTDEHCITALVTPHDGVPIPYTATIAPKAGLCQCECKDWERHAKTLGTQHWCKHGIATYLTHLQAAHAEGKHHV